MIGKSKETSKKIKILWLYLQGKLPGMSCLDTRGHYCIILFEYYETIAQLNFLKRTITTYFGYTLLIAKTWGEFDSLIYSTNIIAEAKKC
jgi:hypothetical protein